jgi:ABC-type multidrug transport system fused ATPase/permease subunit
MIRALKLNLIYFSRFFTLLSEYVSLNIRLTTVYFSVLIFDSLAKTFSAISIIPLINFLSSDGGGDNQKIMLFFRDILSTLDLEYNLETSIAILVFGTFLAAVTEIIFYFVGRKNAYKIYYFFISTGIKNFFSSGLKFINSHSFGVIQNTFQREIEQMSGGVESILKMLSSFVQISFLLVAAFSLSSFMSSITMTIMFLVFILMSNLNIMLSRLSAKTTQSGNEVSHALFEPLMNAKHILSFGRSDYTLAHHAEKYDKHTQDAIGSQTLGFSIPLLYRTIGIIVILISLYYSILIGENPAILIAALVALVRVIPIASQITSSFVAISSAIPSLDQFESLFMNSDQIKNLPLANKFNGFNKSIDLNKVFYIHSPTRGRVSNVSLTIKKNSYVVFTGESGSGKTTCIDIIIGLLTPSSGSVLIDGVPLSKIDLDSFLNCVGYVQQAPFLFRGTIKENLLWSNPNASESKMWDALKLANIYDFVRSCESGLDTDVGDKGVLLSGGQKQRIVLAKALVRNPTILILDEITSSLDCESEEAIFNTLKSIKHKVTIILITHNLSPSKDADIIFSFDRGKILKFGTYDEMHSNKSSLD